MDEFTFEEALLNGSNHELTIDPTDISKPLITRGVIKRKYIQACQRTNRDFFYMDTGYFGNFPCAGNPNGKKMYHRIVKNELQHSTIRDVPNDRWKFFLKHDSRLKWKGWKNYNKKILLVMPNPKSCDFFGINYETWKNETIEKIKTQVDIPIEIRIKGSRSERNAGYTIYDAFDSGVYATVAFNSIAALESVLYGIPAFVSVPCAATPLASNDLSMLKNPFKPEEEIIQKQCWNLAYGQFTVDEILDGTAYSLIKKYSL